MSPTILKELEIGLNAQRNRQFEVAEAAYRRILVEDPDHEDSRFLLGVLLAQTDRETESASLLISTVEGNPNNLEALKWLSGVLSFLGRNEEAAGYAYRATKIKPDDYDALLKLATAYFGQAKYADSIRIFKRAIRFKPSWMEAYYGLATAYLRTGSLLQAKETLETAVSQNPSPENLQKLREVSIACEQPRDMHTIPDWILEQLPEELGQG